VIARRRAAKFYQILFKCSCPASEMVKARAMVWDFDKHFDEFELDEPRGEPSFGGNDNPKAKELANHYAPKIRALLKKITKPLPYNPNIRGELPPERA
jgi:hypothetical protein